MRSNNRRIMEGSENLILLMLYHHEILNEISSNKKLQIIKSHKTVKLCQLHSKIDYQILNQTKLS